MNSAFGRIFARARFNAALIHAAAPVIYQQAMRIPGVTLPLDPIQDQPIWSFGETSPQGTATVAIAFSNKMPSRLVLPIVPGVSVPTGLPPCPGLRGEPCRSYKALVNRSARLSTPAQAKKKQRPKKRHQAAAPTFTG